ncbi:MAG: hypothetical protein KGL75_01430 [Acidobacteriota bacterium]|nr:hypothetical protein [Acidobacteriota bacterium]
MIDDRRHLGGLFIGIVVTAIGVIFLLDQLEIVHAAWVFQVFWPVILIGFGVAMILRTAEFRMSNTPAPQPVPDNLVHARRATINFWGPVLILIGVIWLLSNITHFDAGRLWPLWMIAFGVWLLINKNRPRSWRRRDRGWYAQPPYGYPPTGGPTPGQGAGAGTRPGPDPPSSGFVNQGFGGSEHWAAAAGPTPSTPSPPDATTASAGSSTAPPPGPAPSEATASTSVDDAFEHSIVFMAFKRRITTQHFRYARLSAVFGGFNLDFTLADMDGSQAEIHIEAVFGGGEIRIPPTWRVSIDAHAFGGAFMDETYGRPDATAPAKTLIVRGSTVFGGVVIKN